MVTSAEKLRTEARPIIDTSPASAIATALWRELLRREAFSRRRAVTDRVLAAAIGTSQRSISDAAHELLSRGILVIAASGGRWIGSPEDTVDYRKRLRRRALEILRRSRAAAVGISLNQQQQSLFTDAPLDTGGV